MAFSPSFLSFLLIIQFYLLNGDKTYYYIVAHGTIIGEADPSEDEYPEADKTWNFDSPLVTFKCPGASLFYEEEKDVQKLLEKGKVDDALEKKKKIYNKGDKVHEYVFYFNTEFPATGGIHQLTTDDDGKLKNIELLYSFLPIMEEKPVKLFELADILNKKALTPGHIFWLACNEWTDGEGLEFTKIDQLPAGPKTTSEVEERRKEIFDELKKDQYDPFYKEVTELLTKRKSELEAAIGKGNIGKVKYKEANAIYKLTKEAWLDPAEKEIKEIEDEGVNLYNIGWAMSFNFRRAKDKLTADWDGKWGRLSLIKKAVQKVDDAKAKAEYGGSYYDYGGYSQYEEYDSNNNVLLRYYQEVLRKMKKNHRHGHHKYH